MRIADPKEGSRLMVEWGVTDWKDPGAEYFVWDECCVFAFVPQDGFFDVHMAMPLWAHRKCRDAGAEMLKSVSHNRLRAVILPDKPSVCNYARRMGFTGKHVETLKTINGSESSFFIMWREPGDFHGRSD